MTDTTSPPRPPEPLPEPPRTSSTARTLLFVGLGLFLLLVLLGIVLVTTIFRVGPLGGTFGVDKEVSAGRMVSVAMPNASLEFAPSTDSRVHVTAHGRYLGPAPQITATTEDGVTEIRGGCPNQWFSFCSLDVTISLPAGLPLGVEAQNGRIRSTDLTGPLSLTTTNGQIEVIGTRGRLELHTTNGSVRMQDSTSRRVTASTTNGAVDLDFRAAPAEVDARSTNGAITVRVPADGQSYRVSARTTNGNTENGSVPTDPASRRSITAETTNGNVTVTTE